MCIRDRYDTMQMIPNDVCTYSVGLSASMGVVLLTAGAKGKRYALPNSTMMMHSVSGGGGGTIADVEINFREMQRINEKLAKLSIFEEILKYAKLDITIEFYTKNYPYRLVFKSVRLKIAENRFLASSDSVRGKI